MKNIIKRILAFFLVVYLIIVPPFAYAASAGGWAFSSFDVAKSVVTAMKNGGTAAVTVAKSPISQKIAKGIVGGVIVGAALPLAISQITGIALTAVDWVLDPANNAIKYRDKTVRGGLCGDYIGSTWVEGSPEYFAKEFIKYWYGDNRSWSYNSTTGVLSVGNGVGRITTCAVSTQPPPYNTIPIPTVADKVFDNAKTDSNSRSVVNDAVREYVNEGSADTALDNAKADADASHACGTGTHWSGSACVADTPTTPSTPTTPDTPFDPSGIIDAIRSVFDAVKSIPDVINSAIDKVTDKLDAKFKDLTDMATDWKDAFVNEYQTVKDKVDHYFNDEPVMTDTPLPESNPTLKDPSEFDKDYIKVTAQCPDDVERQIPVGNMSFTLRFPMSPLCDFLSTYARSVIILMAYITAALSIGNAFRVGG